MRCRLSLLLLFLSVSSGLAQDSEPRFGRGPWIFLERGAERVAAPATQFDGVRTKTAPIRLDDGRAGVVTVASAPCAAAERCAPADCGCLEQDRYRLSLKNSQGVLLAETHLWAAYGFFTIITADLVGGPGDELVLVRPLGRSAPPNGLDLKILELSGGTLREVLASHQIAGNLSGTPMVCGQWRSQVVVDAQAPKPRALTVRHEVLVPAKCALDEPARAEAIRRNGAMLIFVDAHYRAR